jgi:hypothetical protein
MISTRCVRSLGGRGPTTTRKHGHPPDARVLHTLPRLDVKIPVGWVDSHRPESMAESERRRWQSSEPCRLSDTDVAAETLQSSGGQDRPT